MCIRDSVRAFLSRTYELLQENTSFFRHFNLRILQCDDQLRSDKKVTNARELAEYMEHFELIGQSATDFRPVFEHVDRLNAEGAFRHLRGLLYFTDGLGIYPKKRPKYDAAFVMLEGEAYPDKVPSWGIRAVISEDALAVEDVYKRQVQRHTGRRALGYRGAASESTFFQAVITEIYCLSDKGCIRFSVD